MKKKLSELSEPTQFIINYVSHELIWDKSTQMSPVNSL